VFGPLNNPDGVILRFTNAADHYSVTTEPVQCFEMGPIYRLYGHYLLLDKTDETRKRAPADVCATPRTDNIRGFRGCKPNSRRFWSFPKEGEPAISGRIEPSNDVAAALHPIVGRSSPDTVGLFTFLTLSDFPSFAK
jgi:hypothetical protein